MNLANYEALATPLVFDVKFLICKYKLMIYRLTIILWHYEILTWHDNKVG